MRKNLNNDPVRIAIKEFCEQEGLECSFNNYRSELGKYSYIDENYEVYDYYYTIIKLPKE